MTKSIWMVLGNSGYALTQWGLIVIMAQLGSERLVGHYALALAVTAPIFMLTNLQLRSIRATDTGAETPRPFSHYIALRLTLTIIAILGIAGYALWTDVEHELMLAIVLMALLKGVEALSDIYYGQYQFEGKMSHIGQSMLIRGGLNLVVVGIAVYMGVDSPASVIAIMLLPAGLVLLARDMPGVTTSVHLQDDLSAGSKQSIISLLVLSLPLGITMMLSSYSTNIPRYVIESTMGTEALGIFAALSYLTVAGSTVIIAIGQTYSPLLARAHTSKDGRAFMLLLMRLIMFAAICGVLFYGFITYAGTFITTILYGAEYAQHVSVLVWLAVGTVVTFPATVIGYAMTALRRFKVQAPLFLIVLLVTVLVSQRLIPERGLVGAAQALLVAGASQLVLGSVVVIRAIRTRNG